MTGKNGLPIHADDLRAMGEDITEDTGAIDDLLALLGKKRQSDETSDNKEDCPRICNR